jgi:ATP-binding cassette subfamily C protein
MKLDKKENQPLIGALTDFVKDLLKTIGHRVVINVVLQFCLGLTQGIGLLLLLPLLSFSGLISPTIAGKEQLPWFAGYLAQPSLVTLLLIFCSVIFIHALIRAKQNILTVNIENDYANEVRTRLYRALCQAKWLFLCNQKSSDLTRVLTTEIHRLANMVKVLFELVCAVLISAVYIMVGLILHPGLLVIALCCGLLLLLLLRGFTRQARDHGVNAQHHMKQMYRAITELFSGMKTIKSQAMESTMQSHFNHSSDALALSNKRFAVANSATAMFHEIGTVIFVAFVVYMAIEVLQVNSAVLLLLLLTFARLMPRLSLALRLYQQLLNHLPAVEAIRQLELECGQQLEQDYANRAQQPPCAALSLNHQIELNNISYQHGDRRTLEAISLTIAAQSTVALVGSSGAGKSTLADIIVGLSVPTAGHILIDNIPLNAQNRLAWRRSVSYVSQDSFLFHDTLRSNLGWLNPEATETQLWHALELAAAKTFVADLPLGLDTIVGDRGIKLSGGEKQRIALARALLNHPDLLILDEATSALDVENERCIQQAIEQLHGKMTIVLIAHRLSTVRYADKIMVLEQGILVESGQWHELANIEQGRFATMLEAL